MKKIFLLILFSLLFISNSNAACDDPLTEGVDYSNCRFSDSQDLQGSYLPNSNLSFASFIQVNFDKSIMMTSNLSFGTFPESTPSVNGSSHAAFEFETKKRLKKIKRIIFFMIKINK